MERPADPYPNQSWSGWGDAEQVPHLPDEVRKLLADGLGVKRPGPQAPAIDAITIAPPKLDSDAVEALGAIVGAANASTEPEPRIRHTRGKSTPDLLRARAGDFDDAPDLVAFPADHDEVLAVLRECSQRAIAVVPFGGGSSVTGALAPEAAQYSGLVAIDLRRMNALHELDEKSRVAELGPGLRGPEAEELLGRHGYTIGHFPQSFEYATLGGFAAARSSGQSSAGYGRFDDLVVGMRVATPAGTLELGRAPKSAAGPDLRQLVLGSEGAFGVITSLKVQLRPAPSERVYEGWRFDSFDAGAQALRRLAQDGPLPTVLRLSDEAETALNLARPSEIGAQGAGGCLAIVGYEGTTDEVGARRETASEVLTRAGGTEQPGAGEHWAQDRYRGPYLRDALLDAGALVETLETVTWWSSLPDVYAAVSTALRESLSAQGTPPVILCHVSHVYRAGASLYFTIGCAQLEDPLAQWQTAKAAANDAILASGASISHHHGVGRDHRDWYTREVGELGAQLLRSIKSTLDPNWILNPGILVRR
jgi:alkyldihydroxyacetonephosphate synthase